MIFKLLLNVLLLLLIINSISCQRNRNSSRGRGRGNRRDQCHLREMEACLTKLEDLNDKSDNPTKIITNNKGIEKICKAVKEELVKCEKAFVKKCGSPLHRELFDLVFDQVVISAKRFCDNETVRTEFLKHSPCMNEKVFKTENYKTNCNNKFLNALNQAETTAQDVPSNGGGESVDALQGKICCSYTRWQNCTSNLISKQCGQKADKSFKQMINRSFGTFTNLFCPSDAIDAKSCKKINAQSDNSTAVKKEGATSRYITAFVSFLFVK